MPPIEIRLGTIEPKDLRKGEGFGFLIRRVEGEEQSLERLEILQEQLTEILTSGDPYGAYFRTDYSKKRWLARREEEIAKYGNDALVGLFPREGHRQYIAFLNVLARAKIRTVSQLLEQGDRVADIRLIGPKGKKLEAAKAIINHFQAK